jgi:hypothetical protein
VSCCFDPLCWLSEKLDWPGSLDTSCGLSKEHCGALRDVDSIPPILSPELESIEISL